MERLKTGEVARKAGVSVDTVRYYEQRGLIDEPPRRASGYRQYPPRVIGRIRFIKQAQKLGFTLGDIEELLRLRDAPNTSCSDMLHRAESKLVEIDEKIAALSNMKTTLEELVDQCRRSQRQADSECPILDAMEAGDAS